MFSFATMASRARVPLCGSALALCAQVAAATTIVPIADHHLVDRAPIVAAVTVESKLGVVGERPVTQWLVRIDRVLKGHLETGRVVVGLPGGERPDGMALHVYGTPPFQPGLEAILFLRPRPDGTYSVTDFPQGAFLAARSSQRKLALRDFSDVKVLGAGHVRTRDPVRDYDRFADWIEDRERGLRPAVDYLAEPTRSELNSISSPFTFFEENGLRLRWTQFDSGGTVVYRTYGTMPNLSGGGATELKRGLAVLTNESTTPIRVAYGGATSASSGHQDDDQTNTIHWTDPNDEIETFSCSTGGTVAIGGPWYDPNGTVTFNGQQFYRIAEGDVVVADGVDCKKKSSPNFSKFIEEVVTHEVGHTLGLGHSSERTNEPSSVLKQAMMYAFVHDDGRGAKLNSDDIGGLQTLYRVGGRTGGTPPPPTTGCAQGTLCLVNKRFEVTATWRNQFNNTFGSAGAVQSTDLTGFFHFTANPNAYEVMVKIVDYGDKVLLFYTELTKVTFTMTVRDKLSGKVKTYTNTAGNCGGIDLDFVNGTGLQAGNGATQIRDLGTPRPPRGVCKASAGTLCLLQGRYSVELPFWRNQFDGRTGVGTARPLTPLAGGFHFTANPNDLELVFMLNQYPDRVLAFYGSVNVFEYRIVLTNETTGRALEFYNPPGAYCGGFVNSVP